METPPAAARRRVERVRHELKRRELEVSRVERLSPRFVAVTFRGPELEGFTSLSFDDHVKLILATDGEPVRRDYTPRRYDAARRELTIEFALHGHGPACDWARQARAGQRVVVGGPRGSLVVPTDYDWHLLAGDETALPAITRRLEELPAGARVIVIGKVPGADRRDLPGRAQVDLRWLDESGSIADAIRDLPLPAGEGFAWCAGEAAEMARVREVLLKEKGQPKEAARIAAYWKRGVAEFHEDLG